MGHIYLRPIINSIFLAKADFGFYPVPMLDGTDAAPAFSGRRWARIIFAGPGAILGALMLLAGMPLWLPGGAAGIDNIVFPLVLAPMIWAILFFHACLDRNLARVAFVAAFLFLVHGGLVASRFMIEAPAAEHVG